MGTNTHAYALSVGFRYSVGILDVIGVFTFVY